MTVTPRALVNSAQAAAANTTQYTSPTQGKGTIIDKFTGTNTTGAAATLTVNLVPSGQVAGAANVIASAVSIGAGASYTFPEVVGHVLNAGDFINTASGTALAITIRSSGREIN
jgi:hypothetical protein